MSAEQIRIRIHRDGRLEALDTSEIIPLVAGGVTRRRASRVEPRALPWRVLFRLLRGVFGEDGRVAAWTRTWRVWWRVDLRLSGGPLILDRFYPRANALRFEVEYLNRHGWR